MVEGKSINVWFRFAEFSKQVKQKVTGTSLLVQNLEEEVTYTFTVRAQTIDYGPATIGNVTTGPQDGSPVALRDLLLAKTVSSVEMHWKNGPSGKGPILGYYIESKKRGKSIQPLAEPFEFREITERIIDSKHLIFHLRTSIGAETEPNLNCK